MKSRLAQILVVCVGVACGTNRAIADDEPPTAGYFPNATAKLAARPLLDMTSGAEWRVRRPDVQRRLRDMLGLEPIPARTDLCARITGVVERREFVVERLLFQSRPGLYVTANLYRPRVATAPLPAILYLCGHSEVKRDGVTYGNKAYYQHHPAWYAANGYVCLILDTLQLGEIPGLHHGTSREGMWWWQSRGYTPAGVEAWNAIRAIDYLLTRSEVDPNRIGVTGRSGGGATTWWVAALDDRVAAAVPVAGITDLTNHIVDGVVNGHCDCMYTVNTHRWDYTVIAALVAPRPLLVENTDHDPIFPEDGVRRIYAQLERVYEWLGAADKLSLFIGKGGHIDSPEIRHASFAFFEKWLKGNEPIAIKEQERTIAFEELKVLPVGEPPPTNRNATIHETFVAKAEPPPVPESPAAFEALQERWRTEVREHVFGGWPRDWQREAIDGTEGFSSTSLGAWHFTSQEGVQVPFWTFVSSDHRATVPATAVILDQKEWTDRWGWLGRIRREDIPAPDQYDQAKREYLAKLGLDPDGDLTLIAPRGIGPTMLATADDKNMRRRYALLGQTLDAMRIWDARLAVTEWRMNGGFLMQPPVNGKRRSLRLIGMRDSAVLALWTAVYEPWIASVILIDPPTSVRSGPALLNVERILEMPQAVALLYPRPVRIVGSDPAAWKWAVDLQAKLSAERPWLELMPALAR
jgi:dienelactone hydrolase